MNSGKGLRCRHGSTIAGHSAGIATLPNSSAVAGSSPDLATLGSLRSQRNIACALDCEASGIVAAAMTTISHVLIALLKEGVSEPRQALRDDVGRVQEFNLRQESDVAGTLFIRRGEANEPEWVRFLRPHLVSPPPSMKSRSLSGVLVIKVVGRHFAIAFGYGWMMLDERVMVTDFGRKVVLNAVDPDQLRSIDAKTVEELAVSTRRQLSRGSSITTFGLDLRRDLVHAITGVPLNTDFASRVTGASRLALAGGLELTDLPNRCEQALEFYADDTYKDRFGWVDHLHLVSDAIEGERLDQLLEPLLAALDANDIYLAPPEIIDEEDVAGYRYSTNRRSPLEIELSLGSYLATKTENGQPVQLDLETLKTDRAQAISGTTGKPARTWPIYSCLVAEVSDGDAVFVLAGGDWFRVAPSYAAETRAYVESLEQQPVRLPAALAGESEGAYSTRVSNASADIALLHTSLFRATDSQDVVEFCDLLVKPNRVVHVKRKSRSATLSHLFQQGRVSAMLLSLDQPFRDRVRQQLQQLAGFEDVISADFTPSELEVAFAVIARSPHGNRHFLPFFSQVSLRGVAEQLHAFGYTVSVTRVEA